MSLRRKIVKIVTCVTLISCLSGTVSHANTPYRSCKNNEMKIALTFDDGPHKRYTEEILDILDDYGIKATFFMIGSNSAENPDIVKRVSRQGHEIGNHTYTHPINKKITSKCLNDEIGMTEKVIFDLTGKKPKLFRPPGGIYTESVSHALEGLDYIPILWTVDTKDWRRLPAESIAQTVVNNTSSGSIILCHDYVCGKSNTPEAMKIFIPKLLEMGYVFVTVSELIEAQTDQ